MVSQLSPGQRKILESKKNLDGSPASTQYVSLVHRNIRSKIFTTCSFLRELYENYPEFEQEVESGLHWFKRDIGSGTEESQEKKSKSPFPDLDFDKAERIDPSEIDKSKAFKGMPGI